jgi:hypothetical protein
MALMRLCVRLPAASTTGGIRAAVYAASSTLLLLSRVIDIKRAAHTRVIAAAFPAQTHESQAALISFSS